MKVDKLHAIRIAAGIILIAAGTAFYAEHLLDHQWQDAHFIIGAVIALVGVWLALSKSSTKDPFQS